MKAKKNMNTKDAERLRKRQGQWYQFAPNELEHSFRCIAELKKLVWASDLVAKAEPAIQIMEWLHDNQERQNQADWLQQWEKMESLRTTLFEVRYGYDLSTRGIVPVYEQRTLNKSSVDFALELNSSNFLIELVSTLQTDAMTDDTEHLSNITKLVKADNARELQKVQSKIVRKVASKKKDSGEYEPHKFPLPVKGVPVYNVILADTRGFLGGEEPNAHQLCQLLWGTSHYLKTGGIDFEVCAIDGLEMAGLFDQAKPGTEAQIFRERIHILALVNEREFGEGCVIKQTRLFPNHFIAESAAALSAFPLGRSQ